ncbi:MAG: tRNA lysidine(34) synthetase TilS [Gemmatimonadota bacterium]
MTEGTAQTAHGSRDETANSDVAADPLAVRLRANWRSRGWDRAGTRVAVACSGGADSLVLLHLLRFTCRDLGLSVEAAHFDHRMRADGDADAAWLRGLCRAWGIPLHVGVAESVPRDEATARRLRYDFLEGLVHAGAVERVATAHQADDQVETVLFRILRGTGITGLQGIPEQRAPGILRPLLPFRRGELEKYAERHHLRPLVDPTNASDRFARNRVRLLLLPLLDEIHPGARAGLLRVAENAAESSRALHSLLADRWKELGGERRGDAFVFSRTRFLAQQEPVQGELLRFAAKSVEIVLSRAGTGAALEFMRKGSSGGSLALSGGATISRDFDEISIRPAPGVVAATPSEPRDTSSGTVLSISSAASGRGEFIVGSARYAASWGDDPGLCDAGESTSFVAEELRFPLALRGWRPGDRTRTGGGGKKLAKLLGELRIPRGDRGRLPVLVDAAEDVLWIPGLHRVPALGSVPGGPANAAKAAAPEAQWHVGVCSVDDA